jgi:basic amino acid/polyamine antiporter, APA family
MTPSTGSLKKEVGNSQFFSLAFGCIVGVAWVSVMGLLIAEAGPLGVIAGFFLGGLVALVVGACYAELGSLLPASGGEVVWAHTIYGVKTCFLTGWLLALAYIAVASFEGISLGWIADAIAPGIAGPALYTRGSETIHAGSLLLGIGGTALITLVNYVGVRFTTRFQDVLTYAKIVLVVGFILLGVAFGDIRNVQPLFQSGHGSPSSEILAVFLTTPFWYSGFTPVCQVMGERSAGSSLAIIGRMLLLAVVASTAFYCLIVLATCMTMPWQQMVKADLPVAAAFQSAFHSNLLGKLVLIAAFMGNLTAWNAVFLSSTRILLALGRAQVIGGGFAEVSKRFGTPTVAVWVVAAVSACGLFLGRTFILPLVNLSATCFAVVFLIVSWGVIRLRRREPATTRAFRVPGGVVTAVIGAASSVFMIVVSLYEPYRAAKGGVPIEWVLLIGWLAAGGIAYAVASPLRTQINEARRRDLFFEREAT